MADESNAASGNIEKFQDLLRQLFQFDCADLDFGIYRIMNHKRDAIERFITEKLPTAISTELEQGALAQQAEAAARLDEARGNVLSALGESAFDANGELAEAFQDTPYGKAYRDAKAHAGASRSSAAVADSVYNHLYTFFSRYYDEGDFISQRRYSRSQRYAIPYNGEEVYLHWANSDQYYVKTDEHFRNYNWVAPNGVSVYFRLQNADVEQNNVKGDRRFFLPLLDGVEWDADARSVTIPFEYRPLTGAEKARYGQPASAQDKIIARTAEAIPGLLGEAPEAIGALTAEHRRNGNGPVSRLQHHLVRYTRRNNSDFFIHKDLAGFLNRELDFYLKNEVLNLDEVVSAGENMAGGWFQQVSLIKAVGGKVIDFLAQIEDFQKMLWEKRKFVTEMQYCITLGNISAAIYPEVAANDAQWDEWRELFDIDGGDRSVAFLQAHPTLVLDTKHYDTAFTDRLLASFDDIDRMTDGLLVHGENWQAIRLLTEKYAGRIQCTYIDPPYNTGSDGFAYKDSYQHSSWLSMMRDRAELSRLLMDTTAAFYCHIDHIETHRLRQMLDTLFHFQREIIWDIQVLSGFKTIAPNWIRGHESILYYTLSDTYTFNKLSQPHRKEYLDRFNKTDESGRKYFDGRGDRRYLDDAIREGKPIGDVWSDIMSFQQQPTATERTGFSTQKPEKLLERIILSCTNEEDLVLDYFGGSGTTAACAKKLNRKYVLCEMDTHFCDVLLPRMKHTLYGKSTSVSRTSGYKGGGAFKYIRLESYEDALDSIAFDDTAGQMTLAEESDEYLLKYMLRWETKGSETLLNVSSLASPFTYRLRIHDNGEKQERTVDVPETFNYLLGLNVRTRRTYDDSGRYYLVYRGETRAEPGREVVVVWRETAGWTEDDFDRDRAFVAERELAAGADVVYVNGDSAIPDARAIEPLFKARIFAGVNAG